MEGLTVGKRYLAKHATGFIEVTLLDIVKHEGYRGIYTRKATVRYVCRNEKTGREVCFKSRVKFKREIMAQGA